MKLEAVNGEVNDMDEWEKQKIAKQMDEYVQALTEVLLNLMKV